MGLADPDVVWSGLPDDPTPAYPDPATLASAEFHLSTTSAPEPRALAALFGLRVVATEYLPPVSPLVQAREDARRIVRHGLADVLAWLGEDVGPEPGDPVQRAWIISGTDLLVDAATYATWTR